MISLFEGVCFCSDLGKGITEEKMEKIRDKGQEMYEDMPSLCIKDMDGSGKYTFNMDISGFKMEWTEELHNKMARFILEVLGAEAVEIKEQQGMIELATINGENGNYRESINKTIHKSA